MLDMGYVTLKRLAGQLCCPCWFYKALYHKKKLYDQINNDAAIQQGFRPPWLGLGSGLDDVTTIVFDIPTDVDHLKVVWKKIGLSISLD